MVTFPEATDCALFLVEFFLTGFFSKTLREVVARFKFFNHAYRLACRRASRFGRRRGGRPTKWRRSTKRGRNCARRRTWPRVQRRAVPPPRAPSPTLARRLSCALDDAQAAPLADPAALPRCLLGRAEVAQRLYRWRDVNRDLEAAEQALDRLPRVAQTNPYLYQRRAEARMQLGLWGGAADDALEAEAEFNLIGDKIRRTLAAADAALALYGDAQFDAASDKMVQVFRQKGQPTSNSPDDIPLLQVTSRRPR